MLSLSTTSKYPFSQECFAFSVYTSQYQYGGKVESKKTKEMSFCYKLLNYKPYICATQYRRALIFQTINYMNYESLSFKCHRFTPTC